MVNHIGQTAPIFRQLVDEEAVLPVIGKGIDIGKEGGFVRPFFQRV